VVEVAPRMSVLCRRTCVREYRSGSIAGVRCAVRVVVVVGDFVPHSSFGGGLVVVMVGCFVTSSWRKGGGGRA